MGKLYDQRDLEFDLDTIDRSEQRLHADIANGVEGAFVLDKIIHEERLNHKTGQTQVISYKLRDMFEKERKAARMRLLRTGQLMSDLRNADRRFKACSRCHMNSKGRRNWCDAHSFGRMAFSAVYWAGQDNLARREAAGRTRVDDDATHDGACNKWECAYFEDRRNEVWPGKLADELAYNKEHFGSLDYKGWLNMMRWSAEEIPEEDYRAELRRLRNASNNS